MKAKEYVEKYREMLGGDEDIAASATFRMFSEFSEELNELGKSKGVKTDASFISLMKEFNQKWNAVAELLEKEGNYGIRRDGFKQVWIYRIPYLDGVL